MTHLPAAPITPGVDYDDFKRAFVSALHASGLPPGAFGNETLDLGSLDRTHRTFVEPFGRLSTPPFYVSAEITWRWDALLTARMRINEEDCVAGLFGTEHADLTTEPPGLRVDLTLRANLPWGEPRPMPPRTAWRAWAREVRGRLGGSERLVGEEAREGLGGQMIVLAWQGEPEVRATCGAAGELFLEGVKLAAWQRIEVPRRWDSPEREPDEDPETQLTAMFARLRAALHGWTEALDHLT